MKSGTEGELAARVAAVNLNDDLQSESQLSEQHYFPRRQTAGNDIRPPCSGSLLDDSKVVTVSGAGDKSSVMPADQTRPVRSIAARQLEHRREVRLHS